VWRWNRAVARRSARCALLSAGARVIKVERAEATWPPHDAVAGATLLFAWHQSGQESIALNVKDPATPRCCGMLARPMSSVQNFAPGALRCAGLTTLPVGMNGRRHPLQHLRLREAPGVAGRRGYDS
jgi:crotonobetainyl-CoA:carnitine CoA-transferase CaiB-like acyl-CoA transferase